ncbi:hypothetical protein P170DRAFT_467201 [Aspergillus steynii IBT 23096]|uniref:F-box domain-containing protein n=1 Tax=Aspergillus steynii IBT 23096 TaxID=1392250 RepID=A0A2I2FZI2_9EURO|nr:uncharacterized protein P170DRAFT_467201 [Aspergillus steynii IBT 23096]PLB46034.1 hypothetical protein P170DRAFT_467201 [Aspergillus steynii IBT 23096]
MTRAALNRLPTEIVHLILGHLGFNCSGKLLPEPPNAYIRADRQESDQPSWYSLKLQTLLSLCFVTRRLCEIVQPILYHEFMLGYGDSWRSDVYAWDGRLISFMRTVAQRRDLAALVKRIFVHPYLLACFDERQTTIECACSMFYMCGNCTSNFFIHEPKPRQYIGEDEARAALQELARISGLEDLVSLSAANLLTVLIAQLPNLEHCSLQVVPYPDEIVRSAGLHATRTTRLPIKTLDLSLRASATDGWHSERFDIGRCTRALLDASPCLETLNLHMCRGISDTESLSLPNLKHLHLTFSRLSERSLQSLLSTCSGLQSFFYEASTHFNRLSCTYHFRLSSAIKHLARHRASLQSLHLDLRARGFISPAQEDRISFTLRDFTSLTHLFLNIDEFHSHWIAADPDPAGDQNLLVHLLPFSIVSLHLAGHITDELPRLESSLLGLAHATLHGQFPTLEEVRWDESEKLADEAQVRSVFADAGVSFEYDTWPLSSSTLGDVPGPLGPSYVDPWYNPHSRQGNRLGNDAYAPLF